MVKVFESLTRSELRRITVQMEYRGYKSEHHLNKDGRYYAKFTKDEGSKQLSK